MALKRVPNPDAGDPTKPKYAFIGSQLPPLFASHNINDKNQLGDITYPIDPKTYQQLPGHANDPRLGLSFRIGHPIGPFTDAAVALPAPPA
ncbi:MAG: hypothetical protein QM658_12270 [Gordonia sp. (in: high G+C Gram-positive bacteria)]